MSNVCHALLISSSEQLVISEAYNIINKRLLKSLSCEILNVIWRTQIQILLTQQIVYFGKHFSEISLNDINKN